MKERRLLVCENCENYTPDGVRGYCSFVREELFGKTNACCIFTFNREIRAEITEYTTKGGII